jgi:uncharacterized protein (TIGR00730 family)
MSRICVFCGSSPGLSPVYREACRALGAELIRRQLGLVYGGGAVGLMGALADEMLARGGDVIGVIPGPLASRELAHSGVRDMRVVGSMHERKATMASLSDGFIALPGGFGTLEETLEILTWSQLGIHLKPVGILNVDGYYDGLRNLLTHATREGFVHRDDLDLLLFAEDPADLVDRVTAWRPPARTRAWLGPAQS